MYENITKEEYCKLMLAEDYAPICDGVLDLVKADERLFPLEVFPYNRCRFTGLCGMLTRKIYYNIVCLIVLGKYEQFYEYIDKWKNEVISYIEKLYNVEAENDFKKYNIVNQFIIDTYVNPYYNECDYAEMSIQYIKKILNNPKYKHKRNIIKYIIDIIPIIMKQRYYDMILIYNSIYDTFKKNDLNIFIITLNKYTDTKYTRKYNNR